MRALQWTRLANDRKLAYEREGEKGEREREVRILRSLEGKDKAVANGIKWTAHVTPVACLMACQCLSVLL